MADVAELGFKVDSSELKAANEELDKLPAAAARAESAATKLATSETALTEAVKRRKTQYDVTATSNVASNVIAMSAAVDKLAKSEDSAVAARARGRGQYDVTVEQTKSYYALAEAADAAMKAEIARAQANDNAAIDAKVKAAADEIKKLGGATEETAAKVKTASEPVKALGDAVEQTAGKVKQGPWGTYTEQVSKATQAHNEAKAGISGLQRALDAQAASTKAASGVWAQISAAAKQAGEQSKFAALGLSVLGSAFGIVTLAITAAVVAFKALEAAAKPWVNASAEAEAVNAKLAAQLKATQGVSGQTVDSIDAYSNALANNSTYTSDAIKGAAGVLLQFDLIRQKFPEAQKAVVDLAAGMGVDLNSAAHMVGRALQDPLNGMEGLRRAGITLSDSQKKLLTDLVNTNQVAKAQQLILDEITKRYDGAAAAARDTLGGALTQLGKVWDDMFVLSREDTGWLRGALEDLINTLQRPEIKQFMHDVGVVLVDAFALAVKGAQLLIEAFAWLLRNMQDIMSFLGPLANAFNPLITAFGLVGDALLKAFGITDLQATINDIINFVMRSFNALVIWMKSIWSDFPAVMEGAAVQGANLFLTAIQTMLNSLLTMVKTAFQSITNLASSMTNNPIVSGALDMVSKTNPLIGAAVAGAKGIAAAVDAMPTSVNLGQIPQRQATTDTLKANAALRDQALIMNQSRDYAREFGFALAELTAHTNQQAAASNAGAGAFGNHAKGAAGATSAVQKLNEEVAKYVATKNAEAAAVGKTAYDQAYAKHYEDLKAKIIAAKLPLQDWIGWLQKAADMEAKADVGLTLAQNMQKFKDTSDKAIESAQIEIQTLGMSKESADAYRMAMELLNDMKRQGIPISDEMVAKINAEAQAMAAAQKNANQMKDMFDFTRSTFRGFIGDLVEGLKSGIGFFEALGKAASNVLDKITNKLIDMAVNDLFDQAFNIGKSGTAGGSTISQTVSQATGTSGLSNITGGGTGGGGFGGLAPAGGATGGGFFSNAWANTPSWLGGGGQATGGLFGTGISGMGALGALSGGIGGIMSLTKGGTGNTIAGIGQLIGAGVSLIPGIGTIAGPIISMVSSLLPGLFGSEPPTITNQEYGQLDFGGGAASLSGGAWGPSANAKNLTSGLGAIGQNMQAIFSAFGGLQDASKAWGVAMQSFSQSKGDWSFANKTSFLVGPGGQKQQWGMGSTEGDVGLEAGAVQATVNSILDGAVGAISDNMRKVVGSINDTGKATFQMLSQAVSDVMGFDKTIANFGKTVTDAQSAIEQVDASFNDLYATASKYGLDTTPLDVEKQRLRLKTAMDSFATPITDEILKMTDPQQYDIAQLDKWLATAKDNNTYLVQTVIGYQDQILNIEELYGMKRAEIVAKYAEKVFVPFKQLADFLQTLLPGGALANVDQTATLAGLKATYEASRATAMATPRDEDAVNQFIKDAQAFAQFALKYYGSNIDYNRTRDQLLSDTQALREAGGNLTDSLLTANDNAQATTGASGPTTNLINTVADLTQQLKDSMEQTAILQGQVARLLGNSGR